MKHNQQQSLERATAPKPRATLFNINALPGPLSMKYLQTLDIVVRLDSQNCFSNEQTSTLYGRAAIAARLVPIGAAACSLLAGWIWSGGKFPGTIDVISNSHFRAAVYGHLIRVHNRSIEADHMIRIGSLLLTSPTRTACDLACDEHAYASCDQYIEQISEMLELYDIEPEECIQALMKNQRWPGHARGLEIMKMIVLLSGSQTLRKRISQYEVSVPSAGVENERGGRYA